MLVIKSRMKAPAAKNNLPPVFSGKRDKPCISQRQVNSPPRISLILISIILGTVIALSIAGYSITFLSNAM